MAIVASSPVDMKTVGKLAGMTTDHGVRLVLARLRAMAEQLQKETGSQTKAATRMGISQSVLNKTLRNETRAIDLETLCLVIRATRINPAFFFLEDAPDDYRRSLLTQSTPLAPEPGVGRTAESDPAIRASLEAFEDTVSISDEERAAARRAPHAWTPDAADWFSWLAHWRRAQVEGRTDLTDADIARTSQRATSAKRKRDPRR